MTQAPAPDNNQIIQQLKDQNQSIVFQLDATKEMFNEQQNIALQLRTTIKMFQKKIQDLNVELAASKADNEKLNKDNADHLAKITELDAKLNPPASEVPEVIPDNGQ